jgi:hypothetical protein
MFEPAQVFIGSSSEAVPIAEAIERNLKDGPNLKPRVWKEGLFSPGDIIADKLKDIAATYDFAVLVFSPDDQVISRGARSFSPRDNIVFELGLFAGTLGRERTFVVVNSDDKPKLPIDFQGVTYATYTTAKDFTGAEMPSVDVACDQIVQAVMKQGPLHNPKFEPALYSITENFRRAFRVDHPLFLHHFERWASRERDESGVWGKGLLRVSLDYGFFLAEAFRTAEKSIFSTSGPAYQNLWDQDLGQRLLEVQMRNNKADSARIFIFSQGRAIRPDDINMMKLHQQHRVNVRVYQGSGEGIFSSDPENIENEWDMIDDGRAIGVTKAVGLDRREAYWYFDDKDKKDQYLRLRQNLIDMSRPLDRWLSSQVRKAA